MQGEKTNGVGIADTVSILTPWIENFGGSQISYEGDVGITGFTTFTGGVNITGSLSVTGGSSFGMTLRLDILKRLVYLHSKMIFLHLVRLVDLMN